MEEQCSWLGAGCWYGRNLLKTITIIQNILVVITLSEMNKYLVNVIPQTSHL